MPRRATHRLLVALVTVAAVVGVPAAASAHTDFDYSVPTEGASVGDALNEITVAFTEAVTLVGPGFEVLDPQGRVLTPFPVTDDDIVFRLQLDPPIGGGLTAVKYTVAAADGHLLEGNFTFTVSAPEPVTTEPPATSAPPTAPPVSVPPATDAPGVEEAPQSSAPATVQPDADAVVADASPSTTEPSVIAPPADGTSAEADETAAIDEDEGGSMTTLVPLGLGTIVVAALAFVLMRSRTAP